MDSVQTIVVGAGVVGLAIAARLARQGREVLLLEQGAAIGQGVSSRNSEVIHAGIYYPEGSLKARLCVKGKALLYDYCDSRHIPHRNTGKLIVATSEDEVPVLEKIARQAKANGVMDIETIDHPELARLEPSVSGKAALLSPSTGIVSAHDLMSSLEGDLTNHGGQIALQSEVRSVTLKPQGFTLHCTIEGQPYAIGCRELVNAAGLNAQTVAINCDFLPETYKVPTLHWCRGVYFVYQGGSPFSKLIYPVPEQNSVGLGIHATLDLGGQVKFGPDTEYVDRLDYQPPATVPLAYVKSIQRYFPAVCATQLVPGYVGIRPKLSGPGEAAQDFRIDDATQHGIEGLVNLFGIESPGLTASLAIGEYVQAQLDTMRV